MKGIYIIEFDAYPGVYKIGKSKDIDFRYKQFQTDSAILGNVKLVYSKEFEDFTKAEKDIHELLKDYRVQDNREFFKGDLETFIKTIEGLDSNSYKIENDSYTSMEVPTTRVFDVSGIDGTREEALGYEKLAETSSELLKLQDEYNLGVRHVDASKYSIDDKIFFIMNLLNVEANIISKLQNKLKQQEEKVNALAAKILLQD